MKPSKIDKLGRVVIPIQYRQWLGIRENDILLFSSENGGIMVRTERAVCRLCGNGIEKQAAVPLCPDCIKRVKALS